MTSAITILSLAAFSLAISFMLSGMEAGVFALSRLRVRHERRSGNPSARLLHGYLESPENFLWTILIGNTFANFAAVSLAFLLLYDWLAEHPVLLVLLLLVLVFAFYAFADLLPKMIFRRLPNRLCLLAARPFRFIHLLLRPFVGIVASVATGLLSLTGGRRFTGHLFGNREELRVVLGQSATALSREERGMVDRVLDLQNVTVGAITLPLAQTITTTMATPIHQVFRLLDARGMTRLPVREEEDGRIVGILSLRSSLYLYEPDPTRTAGEFLQPALYLGESMRLEYALRRLRTSGQRMAIVLDRNRREIGVLTLRDILEFVFGEITL